MTNHPAPRVCKETMSALAVSQCTSNCRYTRCVRTVLVNQARRSTVEPPTSLDVLDGLSSPPNRLRPYSASNTSIIQSPWSGSSAPLGA